MIGLTTQEIDVLKCPEFTLDNLYKQAIINGNFDVWQRGLNFGSSSTKSGGYCADRWYYDTHLGGTTGWGTLNRQVFAYGQTEVPNNPYSYLRFTKAGATGTPWSIEHRIEDVYRLSGDVFTLTFWARASVARQYLIRINQNFGTAGSTTVNLDNYFAITTSWAKYTLTLSIPSVLGKTIGANNFLGVAFIDGAGVMQSGETFDLAQVQLNQGDVALPFQPKSFGQELQDCLRYYEKSYEYGTYAGSTSDIGMFQFCVGATGGNQKSVRISYKVKKRVVPTLTTYSTTGVQGKITALDGGGAPVATAYGSTQAQQSADGFLNYIMDTTYAGFALHWTADAEL